MDNILNMETRLEIHSHTEYSNLRLLDCINKPKKLIDRAIELGLSGICITDHETLSAAPIVNFYQEEIEEEHPNFKIVIGNEIYLTKNREKNQKYYHFILLAKNKMGWQALKELSSYSWMNSYFDRGLERVPTLYNELEKILKKYPKSLIGTTACLGGELSTNTLNLINCEKLGDKEGAQVAHDNIVNFILWNKELFEDDFYIECAPACSQEQIKVNQRLSSIAKAFNVKMVIGSDAHYLKKEDRFVHKAYLNSKGGEREVDDFYEYAYLQSNDEIYENLSKSNFDKVFINEMFRNSMEIYNKIEKYSLRHKQTIPNVEVKDYPKEDKLKEYPILNSMFQSEDKIERYWINKCTKRLEKLNKINDTYLSRLEEEADIKRTIGEKLETNMFAYPVTLEHYVNLFWECGSPVGAGRGSSCSGLNHYLLGVTQLDPIEWDLPFWRYLNKERVELGDIDLDLSPSKRPLILQKIKEERGKNFNKDIDELSKANLGCTLIATFGTEGTRSTILTACRGYRSEEFPDGIEVDIAQYLSSLVPQERGFLWTLDEVLNGNEEKGRKPVKVFINEVNQYPGLLDIMMGIEGLVNKRSSHASGVILFDEDPYEFGSFMKTPNGDIITAFDLHLSEAMGMTKYDFLVTEIQDKITETIKLLQKDNKIEPELSLREVYDKYLHPNVLPIDDQKYWKHMQDNDILNLFQFDSDVGSQAAKKIKPTSIIEMSDANGLMRLMASEKGQETPMEKYIRYKNDINLWYAEMDNYGLTKEEQECLKPHFLVSHGVPPSQEQLMTMLMDENICNFSLKDANAARKIVGKKQMNKIPKLKAQIFAQCTSQKLAQYVWDCGVGPQMGYSFSKIHALAYSFIGFQTIFLAVNWNPIYWNTACLIVNSGSLEEQEEEEIVSIYEKEDDPDVTYEDLPDRSGKKKKSKTTDYKKVAKALSDIISKNIKVSLIDINKSNYTFEPDVENNEILFGLKALSGINSNVIEQIIAGRPYLSLKDFMRRCPLNKTAMVSLIKSGAFDKLESQAAADIKVEPRILVMAYYLSQVCEPKKRLTLQNFNGLVSYNLLPDTLDFQKKVFSFNKYLKERKSGIYYVFDEACENFYSQHFENELLNIINGVTCIEQKTWEKIYKKEMETAKNYISENQQIMLDKYNEVLFKEIWDKYGAGTVSSWEMESLCFYYHEHELKNINKNRYGIVNFNNLNSTPDIDSTFKRNGKDIPIYKIYRIAGTVISKDDNKASIGLLTPDGIVTVKLTKEYYAMINKRVSEKQEDGTKKIIEKGWTTRGTKLLLQGFRRDDQFITKTYSKTVGHQVYLIESIDKNGNLELRHDRKGDLEDED